MHVDGDRWQRINRAFFAAMDAAPEQRSAMLNQLCGDEPSLLQEVAALIHAHHQAGAFLQTPITGIYDQPRESSALQEGTKFGAYRVLRKIEHGGMGEIYLAERCDDQYQKQVAIKIVKRGLNSAWSLRQLRGERQILANLDHPYIARLLDGGTTEDGAPYLVMEYINGARIDEYCDSHRLSLTERLQLFLKVCSAVQYAHQRNIIHRDLKPGNILITPEGDPKLLDFGVAKLQPCESSLHLSSHISTAPWLLTPEYASPEQLLGQAVSASTDVYSLGILLYELLSGRHPYRLIHWTPHDVLHAVCEMEPEKPSACAGQTYVASARGATELDPAAISELRNERPERLRRHLAGDLDNIILKAMHKNPKHRYSSVEQFAQDIRRHLEGLPVIARKNTLAYRAGTFARRNKFLVAAGILVVASLVFSSFAARWQGEREKQRVRADLLHRLNSILEAHDEERGLVANTSSVIFEPGHVNLNEETRERLAKIAGILLVYPNLKLQIEGHTDNHGDYAYNLAISHERAQAVGNYLISQGIAPGMITTKGFGGVRPVATNDTEAGRRQNRRVEIVVSGDVIGNRVSPFSTASLPGDAVASANLRSIVPPSTLADGPNLALHKAAIGSTPCNATEVPDKAFNGSVSGGSSDKWCSHVSSAFLQVDLGMKFIVDQFVIRHAGAGGDLPILNTRNFNIQISTNGRDFVTVVRVTGNTRDVTVHTILPTLARFIRLNITRPAQHDDNASRIYEFEVYCDPAKLQRVADGAAVSCPAHKHGDSGKTYPATPGMSLRTPLNWRALSSARE